MKTLEELLELGKTEDGKDQLRVMLAEIRGWKHRLATRKEPIERGGFRLPNAFGEPIEAWWHETEAPGVYTSPPNYPRDLNACHEVRCSLKGFDSDLFADVLCQIIKPNHINGRRNESLGSPQLSWPGVFKVANASAVDTTIALILTLQKP